MLMVPLTRGSTMKLRPVMSATARTTASISALTKFSVTASADVAGETSGGWTVGETADGWARARPDASATSMAARATFRGAARGDSTYARRRPGQAGGRAIGSGLGAGAGVKTAADNSTGYA